MKSFFKTNKKEDIKENKYIPTFHITATGGDRDYLKYKGKKIDNALKGEVEQKQRKFPKALGEDHPFDFKALEKLYRKGGIFAAVVDKYVDYIWGNRFSINVDDDRARDILEQWMRDNQFHSKGKTWVREAVLKGTGFLELGRLRKKLANGVTVDGIGEIKVLNANHMYIKRDNKGKIVKYYQAVCEFDKNFNLQKAIQNNEIIEFEPDEIAIITINSIGDSPYGLGVIQPAMQMFDNLLCAETELHTLVKRKANAPIVATVGDLDKGIFPTKTQLDNLGSRFEWLNNKHEWTFGPEIKMDVLDFGNFGEKFREVIMHDEKMISWATQVPEVILGSGSVPEGLAKVQGEIWTKTISSKQEDIENVIEQQIFKRVLIYNGLNADVDIIWNQPSEIQVNNRIQALNNLLSNPFISSQMRVEAQIELAKLLEFENIEELRVAIEEEENIKKSMRERLSSEPDNPDNPRGKEENSPQPKVPGAKSREKFNETFSHEHDHDHDCGCGCEHDVYEKYDKDYDLAEWLNFNYMEYIRHINMFIENDNFENLLAKNDIDLELGKLTKEQIKKLKTIMRDGFNNNYSIKEFEYAIKKYVKPGDAYRLNDNGEKILAISSKYRSNLIARTETTRVASEGALNFYEENDIDTVTFVASVGSRTCPICEELNGKIFTVKEARGLLPVHASCRCTLLANEKSR